MTPKDSIIDQARIEQAIQNRYSPMPELTMESLGAMLNAFRVGEIRQAARVWEIMIERDGDLEVPASKLFSDISRLPWEIVRDEESDEADAHADALTYFYTHLSASSVLEGDETGGINLLIRQMMTAHAHRYSVHEMVLQVSDAGKKQVTAQFLHCPVWFFEAKSGRLAYLRQEYDLRGVPLEVGKWLPAVGRGLMRQCSVAYLTKWQPLSYWLLFCYRFGVPGIHGKTDAAKGSTEWDDFSAALAAFANDWVTQTNRSADITLIEAAKGGSGTLPFGDLVERADRLYARAFRGGDLSTQSRAGGDVAGANPQEGEKRIILEDGGQWVTDILNSRVDEPIIAYLFKARPKAWIRVRPPKQSDIAREINALNAARDLGVPVSIDTARERLDLPAPEEDDELIATPTTATTTGGPDSQRPNKDEDDEDDDALANADDQKSAIARATADLLAPILAAYDERLQRILTITDPELRRQKWAAVQDELKQLEADHLADPAELARAIESIMARGFAAGLAPATALGNAGNPYSNAAGQFSSPEDAVMSVADGFSVSEDYQAVSPAAAEAWQKIKGVDARGFKQHVHQNELRHTDKRHGPGRETAPDQLPLQRSDYRRIPEVTRAASRYEDGGTSGQGFPTLRHIKDYPDGTSYVVEEYRAKQGRVRFKTGWKKKPASGASAITGRSSP